MKVIEYKIKNDPIRINVVEDPSDLAQFKKFIEANQELCAWDTETTGLDWWNAKVGTFRIRLAQFGNASESFVIPVEKEVGPDDNFRTAVRWALRTVKRLIAHNGTYDMHVVEETLGVRMEELAPKSWDTVLLGKLVDSRAVKEGGPGHKLEEATKYYIDPVVADEVKGSMTAIAKELGVKKSAVWPVVPLTHHGFNLYAGMDPVLAFRLYRTLRRLVPARSKRRGLMSWEHRLAHVCAKIERQGYLLDVDYTRREADKLIAEAEHWCHVAAELGVESVNSTDQVAEALIERGHKLTQKTPTGKWKVDDAILSSFSSEPLAQAVIKAKKCGKWAKTWFLRFLEQRDGSNRCHASINTAGARTFRMSCTGIPAQTLPAGEAFVRNCFLAEPDHVTVSIDYGNMELRVMAALSGDQTLLEAFRNDADLHQMTADAAGVSRKAGKTTNFCVAFGGGWQAVHEQAGVSVEEAKKAVKGFWRAYPGVRVLADRLQDEARKKGYIYTATGHRLMVDRGRPYAALNYAIQSAARDITARAVIELDRAGFTPWVRLIIHDEIVFSFPKERAAELAKQAAEIMQFTMNGLLIPTDADIADGRPWGAIYDKETKH
ncbi:DNA polymerase [Kitasatospora sp. NPDC127116]|uniref:DNA polymerase n=1 Tax=Kitasatospora sp. NPDC127116 TaxID=3345367 RepID=UPI0036425DD3